MSDADQAKANKSNQGNIQYGGRDAQGNYIDPGAAPNRGDREVYGYGSGGTKRYRQDLARYNQYNLTRKGDTALKGDTSGQMLFGTPEEQNAQIAGLNIGNMAYGQGLQQTGQDIQGVKKDYQSQYDQAASNPVIAAIQGQKAGAIANANRQSAAAGIKGSGASMISQNAGNQKDQEIAATMTGIQNQALGARRSIASNMVGGQTGLMLGSKAEGTAQNMPSAPEAQGMFGNSVVCTELHRQGLMSDELYAKDSEYGWMLYYSKPQVFVGYHFLVQPIVYLMQKSPLVTNIMKYPALKWAKHIGGEEFSYVGLFCQKLGEPFFGFVGKILTKLTGEKYAI